MHIFIAKHIIHWKIPFVLVGSTVTLVTGAAVLGVTVSPVKWNVHYTWNVDLKILWSTLCYTVKKQQQHKLQVFVFCNSCYF